MSRIPLGDPKVRLHASLALLPLDSTQLSYLENRLLTSPPGELAALRNALRSHQTILTPETFGPFSNGHGLADSNCLPAAAALTWPFYKTAIIPAGDKLRWQTRSGACCEVQPSPIWFLARSLAADPQQTDRRAIAAIFSDNSRGETEHAMAASIILSANHGPRPSPSFWSNCSYRMPILRRMPASIRSPRSNPRSSQPCSRRIRAAESSWNDAPIDSSSDQARCRSRRCVPIGQRPAR